MLGDGVCPGLLLGCKIPSGKAASDESRKKYEEGVIFPLFFFLPFSSSSSHLLLHCFMPKLKGGLGGIYESWGGRGT